MTCRTVKATHTASCAWLGRNGVVAAITLTPGNHRLELITVSSSTDPHWQSIEYRPVEGQTWCDLATLPGPKSISCNSAISWYVQLNTV